jgi:hypothetical protein
MVKPVSSLSFFLFMTAPILAKKLIVPHEVTRKGLKSSLHLRALGEVMAEFYKTIM